MGRKQMNRQISSRMGNVIKLSILNLNVFTAKFAEKAQRAAEFLFGEPLCETLRKPLRLSAVIFVTFSVNLTTLPLWDETFCVLFSFLPTSGAYGTFFILEIEVTKAKFEQSLIYIQ